MTDRRPCPRARRAPALLLPLLLLNGCATLGSALSPYTEKFSCKNSDHGQCIHPDQAYADAVAGRPSHSDPAVTNNKKLLRPEDRAREKHPPRTPKKDAQPAAPANAAAAPAPDPRLAYGDLAAGIGGAGTPMLKPSRTVRTLILPYADRQRPDRLYMARYVYSMMGQASWVVGNYLVEPAGRPPAPPVLQSVHDTGSDTPPAPSAPVPAIESRP